MDRWKNRVAVVTGSTSGIGRAVTLVLAEQGMTVVGLDLKANNIWELKPRLEEIRLHFKQCDVTDEPAVVKAFRWIEETLGGVDVLINCAGVNKKNSMLDGKTEDWQDICNVNVVGVSTCTREAVKSMKRHQIDDGHIVYICSLAGHFVGDQASDSMMYKATKHGVRVLAECLRKELVAQKTNIRVTNISPSLTNTEMYRNSDKKLPDNEPILEPEDIANVVVNVLKAPPKVQISEVIVRPVNSRY
ncbi:farnesol dehydrogenase-like [Adelges cooleyi]|uniref:farnesol dehydrogenase-like n=1 Tax=Adelges cooleyi TaxID=133065 RepID=UPI00217F5A71|nr:farnesol dehydrogenase-like [Adelges cooleyi]